MKPFSGTAGARTAGPTSNASVERPPYGVHALWPVGHLPDAEAEHRHLTSVREDAGGPVCYHCAGCHDGCSFALRTCPDTQVGCSWCDWLYLARRRVMM